ncbi:MAG TPA: nicotinate phosphoribosyltransferase [Solirubrobacter sp.]|nr:nicotinate phosphoribosyltransferase [Solirubrobacter sp.]
MGRAINDPGLLTPTQASLLMDQYELTMAASYHRRGMNEPAVFELFARHLPPHRDWLLVAGIGPALSLVEHLRFEREALDFVRSLGLPPDFVDYLAALRFTGDIDAMPEGTIAFADEPLLRVTAPRIEAQVVETLLLNQVNFQTAIATKAARMVLAAGARGEIVDFSPRRDHGTDAAMKAARSAVIAGATGTSNLAAAARYGLHPVGTMAHSYVLSFPDEQQAFEAFMRDMPDNAVMLVDTFDTLGGVRHAIEAARATGVPLKGVRLDSGDLLALSQAARAMLDEAGMPHARIVASGDLDERRIAALVAAGAPIDVWGVGTALGTSQDAPTVGGVYKLVAHRPQGPGWRPVAKRSTDKETLPGPKQVFRRFRDGVMIEDVLATADERLAGRRLLTPAMRGGRIVLDEPLETLRARAATSLDSLPPHLRRLDGPPEQAYPVRLSPTLRRLATALLDAAV